LWLRLQSRGRFGPLTFRDRIVHHLIYNAIKDRFYKRFIAHTYSCIPERGTLKAGLCVAKFARKITQNYTKTAYYLKADLKNFFVSIDKNILMNEIERCVSEEWILKLTRQVVFHDPRLNVRIKSPQWKFEKLPLHKSLWNQRPDKGLPIGNLTSQFFSNVYLDVLDRYVKHGLRCKYYCRYVDDFIMMSEDPHQLNEWHRDLSGFLVESLMLELHQDKKLVNKIARGIDFVGYTVKPRRMLLRQRSLRRSFSLIRERKAVPGWFEALPMYVFRDSINSYIGMLRALDGYELRKEMCVSCLDLFTGCDRKFTKLLIKSMFIFLVSASIFLTP
jgi:hypothetical protein